MGLPLVSFPLTSERRFPRSKLKPVPCSRRLYAGHRLDSKQVSSRLIPGHPVPLVLMTVRFFRHVFDGSFSFVSIGTHLTNSLFAFSRNAHYHGFWHTAATLVWSLHLYGDSEGPISSSSIQHGSWAFSSAFVAHTGLEPLSSSGSYYLIQFFPCFCRPFVTLHIILTKSLKNFAQSLVNHLKSNPFQSAIIDCKLL